MEIPFQNSTLFFNYNGILILAFFALAITLDSFLLHYKLVTLRWVRMIDLILALKW